VRCLGCGKVSLDIVCERCHEALFVPTVGTRVVGNMDVISLFSYRNIESFILTKHEVLGYRVYKYFARRHVAPFLSLFADGREEGKIWLVSVDEDASGGYSHTAVLSHFSRSEGIEPLHGSLISRSCVKYAGMSLSYRLAHPRDFVYRGPSGIDAILIDDIVTTGLTLQEAGATLVSGGVNVLFALTLADASR